MKILFFASGLTAGGKERRLSELLKQLKYHPDIEFELAIMGHEVHYKAVLDLKIKIHYLVRKTRKDLSILPKFYAICKEFQPDIVHCWDSMTAIYSAYVCKFLSIKLVNGMIADAQNQKKLFNKSRVRANLTFPLSDVIVGNSKAGILAYSAPEKKSYIINNGFNFSRIENLLDINQLRLELQLETKYVIGMVATFSHFKDYKTYFNAAKILLDQGVDATFIAIGHNTDSIEANSLIEKKYSTNFRLVGTKANVESYINLMDVCVLSTFTEGISNSILEYMALGKPVVATDGGGTNEIVVDKKTGFLIKPSDPQELATKLNVLLDNPELRFRMGSDGKERIVKYFSIDSMVTKFIELYKSLD